MYACGCIRVWQKEVEKRMEGGMRFMMVSCEGVGG